MVNELFAMLVRLSVLGCAGIPLVAVLRVPVRRAVGTEAVYWMWLVVPAILIAVLLRRAPSCLMHAGPR